MWFLIENNAIVFGPITLPVTWSDQDGVQHPLRDLEKNGHFVFLNSLGWLKQNIVNPVYSPDTHEVLSYSDTINGNNVDSVGVVTQRDIESVRKERKRQVVLEGIARISGVLPGMNDWNSIELIKELWASIAPAARQPTAPMQSVINIYQTGQTAISALDGITTWNELASYDPVTDPGWPT